MANTKISELPSQATFPDGFYVPVIQSSWTTNTSYKISSTDLKTACTWPTWPQWPTWPDWLWVPAGWTVWQGLYKKSSTDNDTEWASPDYCLATNSNNQSIPDTTYEPIVLDTYSTNNSSMDDTANKITIAKSGLYFLSWAVNFASNATGIRYIYATKNWTVIENFEWIITWFTWWYTSVVGFSGLALFALWDVIALRCLQNSWWALNVTKATLSVTKIQ